jgi:hypothetical protein
MADIGVLCAAHERFRDGAGACVNVRICLCLWMHEAQRCAAAAGQFRGHWRQPGGTGRRDTRDPGAWQAAQVMQTPLRFLNGMPIGWGLTIPIPAAVHRMCTGSQQP